MQLNVSNLNALIVLIIVFIITLLISIIFDKNSKAVKYQKNSIKHMINNYPEASIDDFLDCFDFTENEKKSARKLLDFLANLLSVSSKKIAIDVSMLHLFGYIDSISGELSIPFAEDIVDGLFKITDKKKWIDKWDKTQNLPKNEVELEEFIMAMNLKDFLIFFVPLMR